MNIQFRKASFKHKPQQSYLFIFFLTAIPTASSGKQKKKKNLNEVYQ